MTAPGTPKRSLRELLNSTGAVTRQAWQEVILRKCALLREVDEALFTTVLAEDVPEGRRFTFTSLTELPEMVPVPGSSTAYYVRGESRSLLLSAWESDPDGLRDFSRRMWVYYEDGAPLDQLSQMLFASPRDALGFAKALYDAADRAGDLSACDGLLRILRNRSELLSQFAPELFRFLQDREQYLRSRVLFVDDWTRSRHYLERRKVTASADAFLASSRWLMQIAAKGGFGKTAFLRWYISRRLLVAGRGRGVRWPVARIDFDRVNRATIAEAPSLLLVHAADQLDRQVEQGVGASLFRSFLLDHSRYLPALEPSPVRASAQVTLSLSENEAAEIEKAFCRQLARMPALLVLDTVEEMVLHKPQEWLSALRLLERVHEACPGLKVIMAGRHDIRTRQDFRPWTSMPRTRRGMTTITVGELTGPEAIEYLTRIRRLKPAFRARRAGRPAHGNPFKLTLFADRVGAGGRFTLQDLSELGHADVQYLIERIIERLPDCELQWVLRYAVVPNQLTRDFLHDVLLPHVRREAASPQRDRPHENLPPGAELVRRSRSWTPCPGTFDPDRLWTELRKYASASSWISLEGDLPRLQPELVVPMRYLLQSQPVYAEVHREAAAWFERRIDPDLMDPALYVQQRIDAGTVEAVAALDRSVRERAAAAGQLAIQALFHYFQAEGSAATTHWHRMMASTFSLFPDVRGALAESLLGSDFLDDDGQPRRHQLTAHIIEPETVAEAHFELAKTLSGELIHRGQHADAPHWREALMNRIEGHLDAIRTIEARLGRPAIGPERIEVEAQVLSHLGHDEQALALIATSLATASPQSAVRLLIMKANLVARRSAAEAHAAYEQAIALAASALHDTGQTRAMIRTMQGLIERDRGALDGALRHFEDSLVSTVAGGGSATDMVRRAGRLVDVLAQTHRWSVIPAWLGYVTSHAPDPAVAHRFTSDQRCRLDLDQMRMTPPIATSEDPQHALWRASRLALLHHPGTIDAFQLATRLFERAQNTVAAQACEIERLDFIVRIIGNFNEARTLGSKLDPSGPNWLRGQMAIIEMTRHPARERAIQQWKRVWAESPVHAGVFDRALAFAQALAGGLEPVAASDDFARLLTAITPVDARVALLTPFERWEPGTPGASNPPQPALLAAIPELAADDPDFVLRAIPLSRTLQYAGAPDHGRALLAAALQRLHLPDQPLVARRLLVAARLLNVVVDNTQVHAYLAAVRATCADYPGLVIATHVEQAEWWIEKADPASAAAALAEVTLPDGEPDQFTCRFMALQSRLSDDPMQANLWGSQALGVATRLGLPDGRVNLREVRIDDKPMYSSPFHLRAHVVEVRHPAEHELIIATTPLGQPATMRQVSIKPHKALIEVLGSRGSTEALEVLLGERARASELLRGVVPPPPGASTAGLLLRFDDDAMAGLPWEWGTEGRGFAFVARTTTREPATDTVRWVQAALTALGTPVVVDGVAGPQTFGALTEFDARHQVLEQGAVTAATIRRMRAMLPRRGIAIVGRNYEVERSYRTGYGAFGVDVVKLWQGSASGCMRVEPGDPSPLTAGLTSAQPDVVHLTLSVAQTGSDLRLATEGPSEGQGTPTTLALTPGLLSRMLQSALGAEQRPFVILDVPHSGSRAETLKLLYMRNQFAHQLFALGRTRGVLATGLAGSHTLAVAQALIRSVTGGDDAAALAQAVAALTAQAPSALFASDPSIPVW